MTATDAEALRGAEILVAREQAPELEAGRVVGPRPRGLLGARRRDVEVGVVTRLLALPSCEVLEVARPERRRRAAGAADQGRGACGRHRTARRSTSTCGSWGRRDGDRRLHAVPRCVRLVVLPASRRQRARLTATELGSSTTATTRRSAPARWTTRRSAAARGWCSESTWSRRRCRARYDADPVGAALASGE